MAKGLPRSLGRNAKRPKAPIRKRYPVSTTVTVAAAGAGVGFGTAVIGDFPEGNVLYLGAVGYLAFSTADTDLTATWNGDYSVGTTADADGSLATTEINILPSAAVGPAVARVAPAARSAGSTAAVFDNTDGSLELNLNVLVDAADITDATSAALTVTGYVEVVYIVLGDD
jgi:hypothetical protein